MGSSLWSGHSAVSTSARSHPQGRLGNQFSLQPNRQGTPTGSRAHSHADPPPWGAPQAHAPSHWCLPRASTLGGVGAVLGRREAHIPASLTLASPSTGPAHPSPAPSSSKLLCLGRTFKWPLLESTLPERSATADPWALPIPHPPSSHPPLAPPLALLWAPLSIQQALICVWVGKQEGRGRTAQQDQPAAGQSLKGEGRDHTDAGHSHS